MDRERLDLSISSIETIHSIINDIENGEDVGYNASIIPDLEYAIECIKDVILGKPSTSEPVPIQPQKESIKNTWTDTRKSMAFADAETTSTGYGLKTMDVGATDIQVLRGSPTINLQNTKGGQY